MTYNNTISSYATTAALQSGTKQQTGTANAALFQTMLQSHQTNSSFGIGSTGTKTFLISPLQASSASPVSTSANISKDWSISDYYKLPPEEVRPALLEVYQEITDADFTGMSDIEIYTYIEDKFKDRFGDEFMMACYLYAADPISDSTQPTAYAVDGSPLVARNNYQSIGAMFYIALGVQFNDKYRDNEYGTQGNPFSVVNRERLYPDMSNEEIMDTIRAKYPPNNMLTNRDVSLMVAEMESVGIQNYMSLSGDYARWETGTKSADGRLISDLAGYELQDAWVKKLDEPFNIAILNAINNNNMLSMQARGDYCDSVPTQRDFLIKYLGATVGPDGFLWPRAWEPEGELNTGSFSFDITVPDLMSEFIENLDNHYRTLADKRENRSTDNSNNDLAELLGGDDSLTPDSNSFSGISTF